MWGSETDPANVLTKLIRAHGNTAEDAPFLAVLFLWAGARNPSMGVVGLILVATISRFLWVVGLLAWPSMARPNPVRFVGALGTYLSGGCRCAALLLGL